VDEDKKTDLNRRAFIGTMALAGAGAALLSSCAREYPKLTFLDTAPDGQLLRAGLIGCGGRGTGAAQDFLKAGPNLKIVALADVLDDHLQKCRQTLADENQQQIADDHCFVGFDAYKRLIALDDVNVILQATPPHFRPEHFKAVVEAKKHIFMEKPLAVDPVGVRAILGAAQEAKTYGLSVVVGTQRRHQRAYLETRNRIVNGAIGEIVGAACYWNQGALWHVRPKKGWSDMEAMIRDWVNWCWLSGDHIVEQHVHNIDVITWFTGMYPTKALGMGGRMRRLTGDQYDFFAVDFTFPNGMHVESMCRQIDGCTNYVGEYILGTKGSTNCKDTIYDKTGKVVWKYQEPGTEPGQEPPEKPTEPKFDPYVQEHVDFVTAIRTNKPINEAEDVAKSTLAAIMGRMSAYTGEEITWDQAMESNLRLGPTEYKMGPVPLRPIPPVPGKATEEKPREG